MGVNKELAGLIARVSALHRAEERTYRKVLAELDPLSRRVAQAFELGESRDSLVEALAAERSSVGGMPAPDAISIARVQVIHAITEIRRALDRFNGLMGTDAARRRHGELVDRGFRGGLSDEDRRELARIEALLDEADGPAYEALRRALMEERDRCGEEEPRDSRTAQR